MYVCSTVEGVERAHFSTPLANPKQLPTASAANVTMWMSPKVCYAHEYMLTALLWIPSGWNFQHPHTTSTYMHTYTYIHIQNTCTHLLRSASASPHVYPFVILCFGSAFTSTYPAGQAGQACCLPTALHTYARIHSPAFSYLKHQAYRLCVVL